MKHLPLLELEHVIYDDNCLQTTSVGVSILSLKVTPILTATQPGNPTRRNISTSPHRTSLTSICTPRQLHPLQHNIITRIHRAATHSRGPIPLRTF
jgi:hypothetical protein